MSKSNSVQIVAEISANHLGSYERAADLVYIAAQAGADAIKIQTYEPHEVAANMLIESGPWKGRTYHDLYREAATPWEWHSKLFDLARSLGLVPFSSPFSPAAVERLESIDCPIYKIASPEIAYRQLIQAAAATGKPLIISTGMATVREIHGAWAYAVAAGGFDITFLHCLSAYPAKAADFNMATLRMLVSYGYKVGLSDHSLSLTPPVMAVAMGATVIEKHICIKRKYGGPDSEFSLEPGEFRRMVHAVREAESAMGNVQFGVREAEKESEQYRRSLWYARDMKAGEVATEDDFAVLRPSLGIAPDQLGAIIGRKVKSKVVAGTPVKMEQFK